MLPRQSDVLVAGGGPAGSLCATMLARQGYDVVLVDKAHHPRETVGESVLPAAWKYFDLLGLSDEIARRFVKKAGGVVAWDEEITQIAFRDFGYDRPGLHVERAELDELLLRNAERAGARVFEGASASRTICAIGRRQRGDAGRRLRQADASLPPVCRCHRAGLVDRAAAGLSPARQRFPFCRVVGLFLRLTLCLGWRSGPAVSTKPARRNPPMTFVTRLAGWGWSWHIPMRRVTSVGLVVPVEDYRREAPRHASLDDYFLATCRATPRLGALIAEAQLTDGGARMLRDFSYLSDTVAGPGFLVVGDAAGFVDPIFSIGVVMALYSGHLAAWTTDRSFRQRGTAETARRLFAHQMRGRHQLARTMALPGLGDEGSAAAAAYFDFSSRAEKDLMWSAASMTTRSINLVHASGGAAGPTILKRRALGELQPA